MRVKIIATFETDKEEPGKLNVEVRRVGKVPHKYGGLIMALHVGILSVVSKLMTGPNKENKETKNGDTDRK